ncbi:aldose epimerase family protein [Latilactobacillus fuchuensis]|uniref:Maltose epimerase n=1 Tax=Latilactobacillus fuchuensis DSM 14340 = JCM 11249 TaxID=1423747 RepID=A0A0R1RTL0_9LACO|nr:aldose epimerase family protein [Latilactobacillus fuchuensis]KRL58532.1 aldose 1-epimerase [Latilactobacillus fuchuensis DSM 14340 = JCM 11249]
MDIQTSHFDTYQHQPIDQITLTNDHGISAAFLTLGATWQQFLVPTPTGSKNLLLSFPHSTDYLNNPFYVCMAIGRIGGRLKNGQFPLAGQSITVPQNEGHNTLHGGPHGFHQFIWDYTTETKQDSVSVCFKRLIKSSEDGFPGDLTMNICYTLDNDNQVTLTFTGDSSQTTVFNPTSHAYFNLSDTNHILNHSIALNSPQYLAVDAEKIPTGQLIDVQNTPFDFNNGQLLQPAIDALQTTTEKGLDDIFNVQPDQSDTIAVLKDQDSQRQITIKSKRNGLVVYTANSFTPDLPFENGVGHPYQGIALEPQTLPDTPNHPDFGDVTLPANQSKTYQIQYCYQQL